MGFSLYIHIPYCRHICPYCDFNVRAVKQVPEEPYLEGVIAELQLYKEKEWHAGNTIETVYLGGGTPSLFSAKGLGKFLQSIDVLWPIASNAECTLEANPGTINLEILKSYRQSGWNRLSLGVQSFSDENLKFLGRDHTAKEGIEALEFARKGGFENVSVDLIFGLRNQTLENWLQDIEKAISLQPNHISTYNLTIEERTIFYKQYQKGKFQLPEDDVQAEVLLQGRAWLQEAGYETYEISNAAKPGFRSRHNLNYWLGGDYLGIGAGAHSYSKECSVIASPEGAKQSPDKSSTSGDRHAPAGAGARDDKMVDERSFSHRWWNIRNPGAYLQKIKEGALPLQEIEALTEAQALSEFLLTRLRLQEGFSLDDFESRFGSTQRELLQDRIKPLSQQGFFNSLSNQIFLSPKGIPLLNELLVKLYDSGA
ncbi:MAG: radical SAM family heme chaperone HemW [Deltaproteobacteria bacterium]|nr:radical SAM family heme chaperone HemW [Deltaproteobacteria bacterium]